MYKNYLPKQYQISKNLKINHNYLNKQFSKSSKNILKKIKDLSKECDFTLGKQVNELERSFAKKIKSKYAIGVGSGTDAIFLSLKALGVKEGDEVITTPYTFYATVGAIVTAGAKPVFVDINKDLNIDTKKIENAITKNTKVIVPVHWAGRACNMNDILKIAKKYKLKIVEDACHAYLGKLDGKYCGNFGNLGCFSFHPLKNLNVWGDGGIVVTNSSKLNQKIRYLRNHGLKNRDTCITYGYNSRLDTIQAIVALEMLKKINFITKSRIKNSKYLDLKLSDNDNIQFPERRKNIREVFHLYIIIVKKRDRLLNFLLSKGIDAKIHYPTPMHLQPASKKFGYKKGDFPKTEKICESTISLPVHEFITRSDLNYIVKCISNFYK